jgi:hypothetical protein
MLNCAANIVGTFEIRMLAFYVVQQKKHNFILRELLF